MMAVFRAVLAMLASALALSSVSAQVVSVGVGFDRWNYPFNFTPGTRDAGSTFGALGNPAFDDRDAQLLFGFDVSSVVPPSPGHVLVGVALRATVNSANTFVYDPTHDLLGTNISDPDTDPGRPLELFGVGTRNGFTGLTLDFNVSDPTLYEETDPFSNVPGFPPPVGNRSAFAADYNSSGAAIDVTNNVTAGVPALPWAIGKTPTVAPGATVPQGTELAFFLNLADSEILDYVEVGLASGELYFAVTSLHAASQTGPPTFPSFYLDAGGVSLGPTAELDFFFVPEPGSGVLTLLGLGMLSTGPRRRGRGLDR